MIRVWGVKKASKYNSLIIFSVDFVVKHGLGMIL